MGEELELIGRRDEMAAVGEFASAAYVRASTLLLEGEAGIGKTTIWEAGVRAARDKGARVLEARPASSEADIPYAVLTDLFADVPAATLEKLPAPQRHVIDVALGRVEPDAARTEVLTLATALRAALEASAGETPVVVAIDDLQWLDAGSRETLQFALRRLRKERVSLLLARRTNGAQPGDAPFDDLVRERGAEPRPVNGLEASAVGSILSQRLGTAFPRPVVDRITETSAGNPFFALEIGRALLRDGQRLMPGRPVEIPANLQELVRSRIAALSDGALEALLVASCLSRPRVETITRVLGDAARAESGLEEAERASIVSVRDGAISFTHPLLASAIYGNAPEMERRRLHLRLADVVEDEDERARHLGLATVDPDAEVAEQLEQAADRARRRGASAAAGALYERAAGLTPSANESSRSRRVISAAEAHLSSGDSRHARELLESVVAASSGRVRAAAMNKLANVIWATEGDKAGLEALNDALIAAAGETAIEGDIHDSLAWLTCWLGDMPAAYGHVRLAAEAAEATGDPALLARVYDKYGQIEFQIGRGPGIDNARRAGAYERAAGVPIGEATINENLILLWADRLDEALESLKEHLRVAERTGDESMRAELLTRRGLISLRTGDWAEAERSLDQAEEIAVAAGLEQGSIRRTRALLQALRGEVHAPEAYAANGLEGAKERGQSWIIIRLLGMLGFIDLSRGDFAAAADKLDEADRLCEQVGVKEPGIFRTQADTVEALVGAGRLDRAEEALARFEEEAAAVQRAWALATAPRCRSLLVAARGNEEAAIEASAASLSRTAVLGQPFEHGRSLLVAGTVLRRAGRKGEARVRLNEAEQLFENLGALLWIERARAEKGRIAGRAPSGDELTPTELRVAQLVAAGLSNRQVADQLFVTVRTVESNLTRVYGKLGVNSRTQLARRLSERPEVVST